MKYVALLRGINVGGNAKVEMKKLKLSFESLGLENVKTYINSGNIIFDSKAQDTKKLISKIEKVISDDFGFSVSVILRDFKNIQKICKTISKDWVNNTDMKTDVIFLWNDIDSKKVLSQITIKDVDHVIYVPGAIVWNIDRKDYGKSGMNKIVGSSIYKKITVRNINTVRKLDQLMAL